MPSPGTRSTAWQTRKACISKSVPAATRPGCSTLSHLSPKNVWPLLLENTPSSLRPRQGRKGMNTDSCFWRISIPSSMSAKKRESSLGKNAHTLEAVAGRWIQTKRNRVSESHAEEIYRSLELHVFPKLGKLPIHKLRARHVIEALEPIAAKGTLETVKRLNQRLNEIMVYAVNTDLVDANCLSGVSKAFASPKKTTCLP